MPTFSIIVPIYNAEKTLHKCLESIRGQTCPEFEVLMVENGSKDASNAICREYASKDSRFVLHTCEDNCGPSGARNIGLAQASGEFVAFIDSDDFVEADYLETLLRGFAEADVVFFGYHQIRTDGASLGVHLPEVSGNTDYYETLVQLHNQDMFGYTWIKAFRRTVIGNHRFSVELNLLEDEVFACEILTEQRQIAVIPKAIYNYVTGNTGSLVGRTHADYCRKVDIAYRAWKRLLQSYDKKDKVLAAMANGHVSRCMYYGFERDVDTRQFFADLGSTVFFEENTSESWFVRYVRNESYIRLGLKKAKYRLINRLSCRIRRGGK